MFNFFKKKDKSNRALNETNAMKKVHSENIDYVNFNKFTKNGTEIKVKITELVSIEEIINIGHKLLAVRQTPDKQVMFNGRTGVLGDPINHCFVTFRLVDNQLLINKVKNKEDVSDINKISCYTLDTSSIERVILYEFIMNEKNYPSLYFCTNNYTYVVQDWDISIQPDASEEFFGEAISIIENSFVN